MIKKRGLGKKGTIEHELYMVIFQLLLIILIGIALYSFVDSATSGTLFAKNYYSKDIALLTNTLYAAPGDIDYNYGDLSEYFIGLRDGSVNVVKLPVPTIGMKEALIDEATGIPLTAEGEIISYNYLIDSDFEPIKISLLNPSVVYFTKSKNKIGAVEENE